MIVITDEVEETVDHHAVEFFFEFNSIFTGILPDGIDTDEEIPGQGLALAVIECYYVREVVVLEVSHIDIEDIIVRAENDGNVSEFLHFTSGDHLEPAVVELLVFEFKLDILAEIPYHSREICHKSTTNNPKNLKSKLLFIPLKAYVNICKQADTKRIVNKSQNMEVKKTEKANLENRRLLFTEIGLVLALLLVWGAFSYGTKEKKLADLGSEADVVEVEDMVPITQETPPPPPEAPQVPVLSDQIDIVEDDIKVEDNFMSLEDDANLGVEIMDYVEEVKEEVVEEEAIPFQLVEEKPSFNGGDANEFSKWVNSKLVYPEIAKENGVQGRVTLQFTVEKDGSVTNVKVLRGVDSSLDKEAVRVVQSSPKWKPGKQRDRAVKVTYTFPVIFQLR